MSRIMTILLAAAGGLTGQTISQEYQTPIAPVAGVEGTGVFYLQASYSRDARGVLQSVVYGVYGYLWTPGQAVVTGLEIRKGEAGPVILRVPTAPRTVIRGEGLLEGGGAFATGNPAATTALEEMAAGSREYYANVLTEDKPDGAFRGPLGRAQIKYLTGFTAPVAESGADGYHVLYATVSRDEAGAVDSALIQSQASYVNLPAALGLSPARGLSPWRLRVRDADGTLRFDLGSPTAPGASGSIPSTPLLGIDVRDAARRLHVERLLANPAAYTVEAATTTHLDGLTRGALRSMDRILFARRASGPAGDPVVPLVFELDFTRAEDGSPNAGMIFVLGDFATAAVSGAVRSLSLRDHRSGDPLFSLLAPGRETGFQVGRWMLVANAITPWDAAGREALDRLVNYPDTVRVAAGTVDRPDFVSSLAAAPTGPPVIRAIRSAASARGADLAHGSLVTIEGDRLAKFTSGLDGWAGMNLPMSLNGAIVEIGGLRAPLLFVSPNQINAQVPFEVPIGGRLVAVHNGEAPSEAAQVRIAALAPSLFPEPRPTAAAGEIVDLFATGLGQTNPPQATGRLADASHFVLATPTATVGGVSAEVVEAVSLPGVAGVYLVRVRVPAVAAGDQPVVLRAAGASSNVLMLTVR
ncbi:MAG: hypothetical protein SFV51_28570 [Bryobacteraceae bacterium]|nr:hypothetical protein [Bryobacteraceae bacterium]